MFRAHKSNEPPSVADLPGFRKQKHRPRRSHLVDLAERLLQRTLDGKVAWEEREPGEFVCRFPGKGSVTVTNNLRDSFVLRVFDEADVEVDDLSTMGGLSNAADDGRVWAALEALYLTVSRNGTKGEVVTEELLAALA